MHKLLIPYLIVAIPTLVFIIWLIGKFINLIDPEEKPVREEPVSCHGLKKLKD